ncbi:hypothetical protein O181_003912 [Austropuccinia psidii MF-1]|uniref:Uncharacterized protein n=1 Tax=Austropuccinia psidii MF-1 TaxID=1389203 RepID=A0A9Q3BF93_9BASI|nr:hypothetical protein [Austropuccinia psidii MF-1]
MSPVYLSDLGFQRNQTEDREGLFRTRRPGRRHLGQSGGWQDTEGNNIHPAMHFPIQKEHQTRGLERYGSNRLQRPYGIYQTLESHQEVQTAGGEGKQDKGESSHYPSYRRTADPDRAYSDSIRLKRSRPNQLSSGFKSFRNQQISGQELPLLTILGHFQEKTRIKVQKQDDLQREEERLRPYDQEAIGFGERSAQEPEVVLNKSRISSPINRNITPTQIDHNFVTPESSLYNDALWLQMSQYAEQTQKQLAELEASHERMKILTAFMDKIIKNLEEGHAQLRTASEETNKILHLVFEEQHHSKRDRDCLDQDINKLFNVYHNMKLQQQGHVMDNPYHQDDIKPDAMLKNKARSPLQYQDRDNMSYSEKEALKQLPEASSWPNSVELENMIIWNSFMILMVSSLMYQAYQTSVLLLDLIQHLKGRLVYGIQK